MRGGPPSPATVTRGRRTGTPVITGDGDIERYYERARTTGVNPVVYWFARALLQPLFHVYFRLTRVGREHIPARGPVILAANHRSFLDPFVIGMCLGRPVYYVAKRELFGFHPLVSWLLGALGAFPVRRGEGDGEMIETAKAILARGDVVVMFPEGTRTRPGPLGRPRRGVGRLALESGAPVVPVAVIGTEAVRKRWRIRPHKVRIRIGRPLRFPPVEQASGSLAAAVTDRIWPNVMLQWEWLGGLPPLRRATVIGAAPGADLVAERLSRGGVAVARDPAALEPSRDDLVVLAVAPDELPGAAAAHGGRISPRTGVLVLDGGAGGDPVGYVAEHTRAWAVGGVHTNGDVAVDTRDAAFARQVRAALTPGRRARPAEPARAV